MTDRSAQAREIRQSAENCDHTTCGAPFMDADAWCLDKRVASALTDAYIDALHDSFIEAQLLMKECDVLRKRITVLGEALEFAEGAIRDAIYREDGLDGKAGEAVLRMISAALAAGPAAGGE